MDNFEYTVKTTKPFAEAVQAVEQKTAEAGFRVLHTHDIAATLAEKGFPREPLKIVEVCNAKYASQVLAKAVKVSLMLPCPISVYVQAGETYISTLLPTSILHFFPNAGIEGVASQVEDAGLRDARRKGKRLGRPPINISANVIARIKTDRMNGTMSYRTLANKHGVTLWAVQRLVEQDFKCK